MKKAVDRRIQRTRQMLFDAFIDLMIEKGYDEVTVQDIIDRANIGRSTFYLHFTDKEELLTSSINNLQEFLKEQKNSPEKTENSSRFDFSLPMLQHAQGHRRLYTAIIKKKGGSSVIYHMQKMLAELISDDISSMVPHPAVTIPREFIVDFVVNTFLSTLSWWLDQKMACSAEEADRIFHKLALQGLNGLKGAL